MANDKPNHTDYIVYILNDMQEQLVLSAFPYIFHWLQKV